MFIETHNSSLDKDNSIPLTFIKSASIQAYPCGRRRSELIDQDGVEGTVDDKYYLPFDPEARLNTEYNNRKHSSLNGYTQTYLKGINLDEEQLVLSLAGYLFTIENVNSLNTFGKQVIAGLGASESNENVESIYANILLEETPLFSGFSNYDTWVLRNQSATDIGATTLDLLTTTISSSTSSSLADIKNFENDYFSGLSFSVQPLTKDETNATKSISCFKETDKRTQYAISLRILDKHKDGSNYAWKAHEPAHLPHIEHGDTEDSVKVNTLIANYIEQNGTPVPSLSVVEVDENKYQLQFSFGSK